MHECTTGALRHYTEYESQGIKMTTYFLVALAASLATYWMQDQQWKRKIRVEKSYQLDYEFDVHILRWKSLFHLYKQDQRGSDVTVQDLYLLGTHIEYLWSPTIREDEHPASNSVRMKVVASEYGVELSDDFRKAAVQLVDLCSDIVLGVAQKRPASAVVLA